MTFIRTTNPNAYHKHLLMGAFFLCAAAIIGLIILYNSLVSFRHTTADLKEEVAALQNERASLEERRLELFDAAYLASRAAEQGLVVERNPSYLKVQPSWLVASHH